MMKYILLLVLCVISMISTILILRVRDAIDNTVTTSRYSELLSRGALTENKHVAAEITGEADDWTAVPRFLCGGRHTIDVAVLLMLLPTFMIFLISAWSLISMGKTTGVK